MEATQGYRDLGFGSLSDWAHTKLERFRSPDQVSRLCAVTTKVIAALDAEPWTMRDTGEKIDGQTVIAMASPSSLMKRAGAFAASDNGEREEILSGLLTGTSDYRRIGDYTPKFGKAEAFVRHSGDNTVEYYIKATEEQSRVIDNQILWMLEVRQSEDEEH